MLHAFRDEPSTVDHWYEHAIGRHITEGGSYVPVAVPSPDWVEIDDEADLEAARLLRSGLSGGSDG